MLIIIEGLDNSGKSTLAQKLSHQLNIPIQEGSGPPKTEEEFIDRVNRYLEIEPPVIFDRHPVISESIYGPIIRNKDIVTPSMKVRLFNSKPIIIYCDPQTRGLEDHKIKDGESIHHINGLYDQFLKLLEAYRSWAIDNAHYIYRIGDPIPRVSSMFLDIVAFHEKFGLAYPYLPRNLPEDLNRFRMDFMHEELFEYSQAWKMADKLDALVDLAYVVLGTAYLHGFNFEEAWRRVHEANMKKVRAERSEDSKRGSTFDVIKPPGWTAPKLNDLVGERD